MSLPRPLKIVHIAATPVGAPWMVALLREQKRLGHEVAAIIPALDGGIGAQLEALGIPCYAAGVDVLFAVPTLRGKVATIFRLARLLRRIRPDVVHSHIVNSVVTTRIASWIADVPVRLSANAHPMSLESDVLRPIEVGTAFCDTTTIPSCTYTRELMIRHGVPEDQVRLIYYAVDQSGHDPSLADGSRVRRELGIGPDTPVVGKIAYFYPPASSKALLPPRLQGRGVKGHEVLIRSVARVLESIPEAKFVLVGRGWGPAGAKYEQELKDLVKGLGVSDAVLFPGERTDIPDIIAAFDVSAHCSLSDNLAGTVETLLMAKPMVVSDIRGFADTVQHEETGLVVPMDDPTALADAIVRLLRDRELSQRLGETGRQRMLARFTLARTVADLEALLALRDRRAEQHYRLTTSAARAVALPFRLLPVALEVYRVLRRHGFSLRSRWKARAKHVAWRLVGALSALRLRIAGRA